MVSHGPVAHVMVGLGLVWFGVARIIRHNIFGFG